MAKSRKLTRANSAMKPGGSRNPGRQNKSAILNARSSKPVSVLNGGRQYFGPLWTKRLGYDD
jgi:hypothetical protein